MSNESSDDKSNESQSSDHTIKLKYEVLLALVSFLVSVIYSYNSLHFRVQDNERAITSLCAQINILLAAKGEPYILDCAEL